MQTIQSRRAFIAGAAAAGAASLIGTAEARAEAPLETTSVRLPRWVGGSYCWAGAYIAGELMRADGFTDVRYIEGDRSLDQSEWIARGETDFSVNFPPKQIASIDAGVPTKVLTGLHSGCLELIAKESIHSVADLRGKRVGVDGFNNSRHVWLTLMASYVGLDPANDIHWVLTEDAKPTELFVQGKIDAFLGTPPQPQELRAKGIGHTILNNAVDRPWSQYFCCMISATTDYVNSYPVATKRVLRAILKAADLCTSDAQWVARQMVDRDFVPSYDYALQTLKDIRYDRWRDFDPEDSLRFYALRMQETGMIRSSPQEIIASGTDWRFLNELKRELKT
ncbi:MULTISPECIES: ABC transporter substrate-binding protein [Mesorhizobium]|uniref:ABC transporter substrate-binding protein n=1 Tax=Mesorhizobium TaxID=68287 RepID=UPI0011F94C33|nr:MULTISPECIES: ABC transporter substrate-binding protein [unclassified Mesorhizobium]MDX8521504.1 ABC transporter substrate-binding protein [Mesorhizobium sp. VK23D]TIS49143.1 MAG: ABC transporter substrate-binding protein [Mesorhizobium sp.]